MYTCLILPASTPLSIIDAIKSGIIISIITNKVTNTGDRAIQVGSHFHFFEVNKALKFDREKAYGTHLDIASGTSVRFEPGEEKEVDLVMVGGTERIFGFNGLTEAQINEDTLLPSLENAKLRKFI